MYNRPELDEGRVNQIKSVIESHPGWGRTKISKHLCELWGWRGADGSLKDISCRDMLRAADKAGRISLPAPKRVLKVNEKRETRRFSHDMAPITCGLAGLLPLDVRVVSAGDGLAEWRSLLDTYHYLGFDRTVGENMKYMIHSKDGVPLACFLFGSAAWSCRARDEYIGWDKASRSKMLPMMTNNTRFLILPWVRVPHLASHALSVVCKRIPADWGRKYGHGLLCLETFVEQGRFAGTCYKAANWVCVGETQGRGRDDRHKAYTLPKKDVYLYPLVRDFRSKLRKGGALV